MCCQCSSRALGEKVLKEKGFLERNCCSLAEIAEIIVCVESREFLEEKVLERNSSFREKILEEKGLVEKSFAERNHRVCWSHLRKLTLVLWKRKFWKEQISWKENSLG